jgi:ABC-type transport system substrate-binding protein
LRGGLYHDAHGDSAKDRNHSPHDNRVNDGSVADDEAVRKANAAALLHRLASDPPNFDSGAARTGGYLLDTVYQQYVGLDWTRGPAGSGVTNFAAGPGAIEDYYMPLIAESWELPQQGVWVLQIRKGVHWQKVPSDAGRLMGGREVTADDIVSSFNRLLNVDGKSPNSWIVFGQPAVAKSATIEKTGPWEVTIKTPVDYMTSFTWLIWGAGFKGIPRVVAV